MSSVVCLDGCEFYLEGASIKWRSSSLTPNVTNQYADYDKILIINSTKAGKQTEEHSSLKEEYANLYYEFLSKSNANSTILKTEDSGDILNIAKNEISKLSGKKVLVVILSGDTSIKELIEGITKNDIFLDILHVPFGTANALFWDIFKIDKNTDVNSKDYLGFNDILIKQFFQFAKGSELKKQSIPIYSINSTKPGFKQLAKCFLLVTTGFHATLLKVATVPEYAHLGNERFLKAANDLAGDKYHYNNYIEIINKNDQEDVIFNKQESSYFGIFNQGRLERGYDISPKSDFNHRYLLSIKEEPGKKVELFNKIKAGYGPDPNELIEMYQNDPLIEYKEIDISTDLIMRIYPNTARKDVEYEKNVCIDGYLVPVNEISNGEYLELSIEKIKEDTIRLFGL